jgi:hypothetical protein
VERIFTLGFALEQLHRNFRDLERCVAVISGPAMLRVHARSPSP